MSDLLAFDPAKAAALQGKLEKKKGDMEATLRSIKRLVERTVDQNWEGGTRETYKELYETSSGQVVEYLNTWIENVDSLIKEATAAKLQLEQDEQALMRNANNADGLSVAPAQ